MSKRKRPRLTREQARQAKSLVEDGGWTRADAVEIVLAGMGDDATIDDAYFAREQRRDAVNRIVHAEPKAVR